MGNFFSDPFGGSLPGRILTKAALGAAGSKKDYSVFNPEKNNKTNIGQALSTNDKFSDYENEGKKAALESANKFTTNEWGESVPIDRSQTQEKPSAWQKAKTAISNWWNKDNSQQNSSSLQVLDPSKTIDNPNTSTEIKAE